MENPLLIIDSSCICHMQKHAMEELSYDEQAVGVIFGFFRQLYRLMELRQHWNVVFVWDSQKSFRKELFPDYKGNRNHKEKTEYDLAAYSQFSLLREELLKVVGFTNNFIQEGYEADDLIAQLCRQYRENYKVIASTDNDLYQLLDGDTTIYNLRKKEGYYAADFFEEYEISPKQWATVKSIAGCKSDNVPGVPKIGAKTACKYLNGELKPATTAFKNITSSEGIKTQERNRILVTLPFPGTKTLKVKKDGQRSIDGFIRMCQIYGFESFLKDLKKWKERFNLA